MSRRKRNAAIERKNYYSDSRVQEKEMQKYGPDLDVDDEEMQATVIINDEEIGTINVEYEVCPQCRGSGSVVDPNIDSGGIPARRFQRDPEFADHYDSGTYDIECPKCSGKRVVPKPNPQGDEEETIFLRYLEDRDKAREYVQQKMAEKAMGA